MKLGISANSSGLVDNMQRLSTDIHDLQYRSMSFLKKVGDLSDGDLTTIFTEGGSSNAAQDVTDFRAWQASLQNFVDNYTGIGTLSDNSSEICKRARS